MVAGCEERDCIEFAVHVSGRVGGCHHRSLSPSPPWSWTICDGGIAVGYVTALARLSRSGTEFYSKHGMPPVSVCLTLRLAWKVAGWERNSANSVEPTVLPAAQRSARPVWWSGTKRSNRFQSGCANAGKGIVASAPKRARRRQAGTLKAIAESSAASVQALDCGRRRQSQSVPRPTPTFTLFSTDHRGWESADPEVPLHAFGLSTHAGIQWWRFRRSGRTGLDGPRAPTAGRARIEAQHVSSSSTT